MSEYSPPMVTISLAEYNDLQKIKKNELERKLADLEVVDLLKRAAGFLPLYIPTGAHREHNNLGLEIRAWIRKYEK